MVADIEVDKVVDKVTDMVVDMKVDKVADEVAFMVVDMDVDMVADMVVDMEDLHWRWIALYLCIQRAHRLLVQNILVFQYYILARADTS